MFTNNHFEDDKDLPDGRSKGGGYDARADNGEDNECDCDACADNGDVDGEENFTVTMVDQESGEEFEFEIADQFDFEDEVYLLLLTPDEDPEAVFVRVVTQDDGTEALESLEEEEFDRVYKEYDRLCAEAEDEDDDDNDDNIED